MPRRPLQSTAAALALLAFARRRPARRRHRPHRLHGAQSVGAGLRVTDVVAADAAGGAPAAAAFTDRDGGVWAARVRADGSVGSPLPAATGRLGVHDVRVAVTDRGALAVVWAVLVDRRGRSAVRCTPQLALDATGRVLAA